MITIKENDLIEVNTQYYNGGNVAISLRATTKSGSSVLMEIIQVTEKIGPAPTPIPGPGDEFEYSC